METGPGQQDLQAVVQGVPGGHVGFVLTVLGSVLFNEWGSLWVRWWEVTFGHSVTKSLSVISTFS